MKLDPIEQRLGYIWFFSAGSFAVILSLFLYWSSVRLEASPSEITKANTLLELRTAQSSLNSGTRDPRLETGSNSDLRIVSNEEAGGDHGHDDQH